MEGRYPSSNHSSNDTGRVIAALGMIMLGGMFFMGLGMLWPLLILLPGLIMVALALQWGEVGAAIFAIPGSLVAGLGGVMLVQNLTGYWASWAYAWTLFPVFVGLGLHIMGQRMNEPSLHEAARWTIRGGLITFAIFGVFFEFMIGLGGIGSSGATLMILAGMFILYRALAGKPGLCARGNEMREFFPEKAKRSPKQKNDDFLFTGPVVVGSRARQVSRLTSEDDAPDSRWR